MNETSDEIWLIAGGEPGAVRFGQLVQRRRKGLGLSVEELADQAGLSVGTIRAVEQGRRAPSEQSGVRLLRLLLPEDALSAGRDTGLDQSFTDPETGTRVILEFNAKTAGDNRRWSSDKPPPGESKAEAAIRQLMAEPERFEAWLKAVRPALLNLGAAVDEAKARAARPASDAMYGNIIRRLANSNEFRIERIERLLDWWDAVDNGTADKVERDLASQVNQIIDSYYKLPDAEVMPQRD
ncbi:hypothetical protein UB45_04980 [Terrabacter sp. 28]|nr:hypothetical protein UB45_04980 [Terrabacter sp. 28]